MGFGTPSHGTRLAVSALSPSFLHTRRPGLRRRNRVFSFLETGGARGHRGCIVEDVGRGTLSDPALTSGFLQRIVEAGFSLYFRVVGHLAARPSRGWGEMRRRMPWRSQMV